MWRRMICALLFSTSALAGSPTATTCVAHFGFSEWQATLDEVGHELFVFTPDGAFMTHGRYTETKRGSETIYFISYDFAKSAALSVRGTSKLLCIDSNSCSPCK